MVLEKSTSLDQIKNSGNAFYPDRVKFCVDRKQKTIAIDEEMHIDMEHELYDHGSEYEDIFGGDIVYNGEETHVVWESHPNIARNRELGIGAGRELTDVAIKAELEEIVHRWIGF